jgi:hypothetical protein
VLGTFFYGTDVIYCRKTYRKKQPEKQKEKIFTKGQKISKANCEVLNFPKKEKKIY